MPAVPSAPSEPSRWIARAGAWIGARESRLTLACALGAAAVSLFFFFPRYWLWRGLGFAPGDLLATEPELSRAFFALQQLANPWQRVTDATHQVIEWRLFWPVVAHYTAMPRAVYLALPHAGGVLALLATARIVWRATGQWGVTATATLLAATSSWFFVSTGWLAYFDSWLVLALLLASFARTTRTLVLTALFAPWIDERFVLALPLCLAVRGLGADGAPPRDLRALLRDALALGAAVLPYLVVRLGAEIFHLRETSASYWSHRSIPPASAGVMLIGVWQGLRLGWVAGVFALGEMMRTRRWVLVVALLASFAVTLCVADDLSRSASIASPLFIAGLVLATPRGRFLASPRLLLLLCLGNLVLPAAHIIAKPANDDETYHSEPLLYLYAEMEHAHHQPAFANPAAYNQLGLDAYRAGDAAKALKYFDIALSFDPAFAKARANRGLTLFVTGHRPEAMTELDRALREQPNLHDARLQRASLRRQLGDTAGALADAREALRRAPADWSRRTEAAEFERTLAAGR